MPKSNRSLTNAVNVTIYSSDGKNLPSDVRARLEKIVAEFAKEHRLLTTVVGD